MNRILITGGTGHLGHKVAKLLISKGHKIAILSTKTVSTDIDDNITYYTGNLSENIGLKEATHEIDIVVHCASNPRNFKSVDIEGTKNLLKAIGRFRRKHFVYIYIYCRC